jgi:uncharacterized cupredoxin-like copper-binding protein
MAVLLALALPPAWAHGDMHQKNFDPANIEQKKFGMQGDPLKVSKTIRLVMSDNMRFTPSSITVTQGATIRFVVVNDGKMQHELVIGTMRELQEHAELMKKFPGMEHDEPHMVHAKPGKSEPLVWTFNKSGEFDFACLIAGHFNAGMTGKIKVVAKGGHAHND